MRAALLAACLQTPAAVATSGMAVGYNVGSDSYYLPSDHFIDRLRVSYPTTQTYAGVDAQGYPLVANGGSILLTIVSSCQQAEYLAAMAGEWVVRDVPSGFTVSVTGGMVSSVAAAGSGRWLVTLMAPTIPHEPSASKSGVTTSWLALRLTNGTGATTGAKAAFVRSIDEADWVAGYKFTSACRAAYTTASNAPHRMLNTAGGNDAWIETISQIPPNTPFGITPDVRICAYGASGLVDPMSAVWTGNSPRRWSPEEIGKFGAEVGRGVHINVQPQMSDATMTEYFNRIKSALGTALPVYVEPINEIWNTAYGFSNQQYLSQNYGVQHGLADVPPYANGAAQFDARMRNAGHFALRCWKIADQVFGRSRTKRVLNCQLFGFGSTLKMFEVVDSGGLVQAGATVGNLADHFLVGSYYNSAPLTRGNEYRAAIKARAWEGATALDTFRAAAIPGISLSLGQVDSWNASSASSGKSWRITGSYEFNTHDDFSYGYFTQAQYPIQMMEVQPSGGLRPATGTVSGIALSHGTETVADFWRTGDVARIAATVSGWAGKDTQNFVRDIDGDLFLYVDKSSFDAGTPLSLPVGSLNILQNSTAIDGIMNRCVDVAITNRAALWNEYFATAAAKGMTYLSFFVYSGNLSECYGTTYDARPWAVKRGGVRSPQTATEALIKAYV